MDGKQLGKITKAVFGRGGYQEAMIGLTLTFEGGGYGCQKFDGMWAIERSPNAKWSEEDRIRQLGETVMRLNQILTDAKVETVDQLVGIPVELTFEGNVLKDWRVLTEVL